MTRVCWGCGGACAYTGSPPPAALDPQLSSSVQFANMSCLWCRIDSAHRLECGPQPGDEDVLAIPLVRSIALDDVASIGTGASHSCAVRLDGGVWCWGTNIRGQLARPPEWTREPEGLEPRVLAGPFEPAPVLWPGDVARRLLAGG